ncbi:MAG: hypothetical protein NXI13_13835 [Proteobacteria bacterium]|nr:hypothetical protein [Pseudomonadota bacterium]
MPQTPEYKRGYSAGYAAGRKEHDLALSQRSREIRAAEIARYDGLMIDTLKMLVPGPNTWTIGKKKVDNAERYTRLAKKFVDQVIGIGPR